MENNPETGIGLWKHGGRVNRIPFDDKEIENKTVTYFRNFQRENLAYPIPEGENLLAVFRHEAPLWFPLGPGFKNISPSIVPDNIARGYIMENAPIRNAEEMGGMDMFGVDWIYQPENYGSMVISGHPILADANDWKNVIMFPDVESWEWENYEKVNGDYFGGSYGRLTILNGFFERLISFMDFENAALSLVDEEQKNAVHELLDAVTDVYEKIIDRIQRHTKGLVSVLVHDDWGGQFAPFFSRETVEEMILPHLKKLVQYVHSKGLIYEMHSCGKIESLVPVMIEAGVDAWAGQPINDKEKLFELYGDRIILGIDAPEAALDVNASSEDIRISVNEFFEKYCMDMLHKPAFLSGWNVKNFKFTEELYRLSRKTYDRIYF